ncbi:GGDEF domain-containing protein [Pseudonocardia alni]|uniref:Diguanylate cyclase (GGDEF)-like protein n=1 Tax=Pseudonocardia alni TaxID=33907 RepID=A0AA44UUV0_PSEA5|nr:GGDEF domain-containing protein [Pseudonocardia alni]PKB33634.1 diguanylate cyclase (GGDEF)-like protein [Pseudonocardia alni]
MAREPVRLHQVTRWPIWSIPGRLLGPVLAVELLAVCLVLAGLLNPPRLDHATLVLLATLTVAGILHTEVVAGVERIRRYTAETHHVNLTSVWTFASALLLPPVLGAFVVVVVYTHLYVRVLRPVPPPDRRPVYREVYSTATVILSVHAAAGVLAATRPGELYGSLPGTLALLLALLTYTVVNTCLVLGVVAVASPDTRVVRILFGGDELTLELATLCLGALTAGALAASGPFVALLAVPPILALHRTILVRQLRERADTDAKTGLLNHAAWHLRGTHELTLAERERRPAALLILDLDHFKEINDTHGHLYGDQVLAATAQMLREELRDHDLVGRFGGEEFVVLLPRLSGNDGREEVRQIAERLRRRIAGGSGPVAPPDGVPAQRLPAPSPGAARTDGRPSPRAGAGITVSIGGALFPDDGHALTGLLEVADSALYAAKRAGRDAVRIGRHTFPAEPEHA